MERTYKRCNDDQWTALNPDGKKVYDRDFLLSLRNGPKSKTVHKNIPMDIFKKTSRSTNTVAESRADITHPIENKSSKYLSVLDHSTDLAKDSKVNSKNPQNLTQTNLQHIKDESDEVFSTSKKYIDKQLEKNAKHILKKYLNDSNNLDECAEELKKSIPFEELEQVITIWFLHCMKLSKSERMKVSNLCTQLIGRGIILVEMYCSGLGKVLNQVEDIPETYDYFAEMLVKPMCTMLLKMDTLLESCKSYVRTDCLAKLLATLLDSILEVKGTNILKHICKSSQKLCDFISFPQIEEFAERHKLDFVNNIAQGLPFLVDIVHERPDYLDYRFIPSDIVHQNRTPDRYRRFRPVQNREIQKTTINRQFLQQTEIVSFCLSNNEQEEQLERKVKNILDEYLNFCYDLEECIEDVKISIPCSALMQFVSVGFLYCFDRSRSARIKVSYLFAHLLNTNTIPVETYCVGLAEVLSQAEDLRIDIPKIYNYLPELLVHPICSKVLRLEVFHKSCESLISQGYAGKLLAPLLKLVVEVKGPNFLDNIWRSSRLQFTDFMPPEESDDFVKQNQLEFLVGGGDMAAGLNDFSYEQIEHELLQMFKKNMSFNDQSNWIIANIGDRIKEKKFIRTLATAIFKDSIVNSKLNFEVLKSHYKLFERFVDTNLEFELECLYALQTLVKKLEHSQEILLSICSKLYDDGIFSQDGFVAWETSTDPAEMEGKGVALKQLTIFFTQLKENDEDEGSSGSEEY